MTETVARKSLTSQRRDVLAAYQSYLDAFMDSDEEAIRRDLHGRARS